MAYHDFTAGAVLTAAQLETYCELQSIMRFTNAAQRNSQLSGVLEEGLFAFLLDTNTLTVYTGSAWSTIGPVHGAETAVTPTITQSGAVTHTVNYCSYTKLGRRIMGNALLSVTGSGTGANDIVLGGFPESAGGPDVIGSGYVYDLSATKMYPCNVVMFTSTTIKLRPISGTAYTTSNFLGSSELTAALAAGDTVAFSFTYPLAADA